MSTFQDALAMVLRLEGGDWDDPVGGPTRAGITQPAYDKWRQAQGLPPRPVYEMESHEPPLVYRDSYWLPAHCPDWPPAVARIVFDTAVQRGPTRAVKDLQAAVGVDTDGIVGPVTRGAVAAASVPQTCEQLLHRRSDHYWRRAFDPDYGGFDHTGAARATLGGWLRRLNVVALQAGQLLPAD